MQIEIRLSEMVAKIVPSLFGAQAPAGSIVIQQTRKEFAGDFTIVVFPFVTLSRKSPEQTGQMIGEALVNAMEEVSSFNVIRGFLNISLSPSFWFGFLDSWRNKKLFDVSTASGQPVVVEFSSPNTNKPLHLGHIRNNLLGFSIAKILEADCKRVVKVNLVNDRGIHICKSMLAWMQFGNGETPLTSGRKGDKLVGDYYVRFETELREEAAKLMKEKGIEEEEARRTAPLMQAAQALLRKWEQKDPETIAIWETMNGWVYEGFDETYRKLGITFDKTYYESETYLLGKEIVVDGLEKGILLRKEDGSVWADLTDMGLDEKLLLRADGTSVYMTQDLGTAQLRYNDYQAGKMIYVVGNEQNYHFDVLQKVLKKLGKPYADAIFHLSYGMVELPEGKMKSREGTVVDADELISEMVDTARRTTEELGKTAGLSHDEKNKLYHTIGMGALKYFMLKVDPRKNMLFNPAESIDFNGHTGPFIQYTYARIRSVMRSAGPDRLKRDNPTFEASRMNEKEKRLLKILYGFHGVVAESAREMNPASLANYLYELAREFNQFYHDYSILNEPDKDVSDFRLQLAALVSRAIHDGMGLLGIDVPEKM